MSKPEMRPSPPPANKTDRVLKRRRAEQRFKFYCQAMISLAVAFVFLILWVIASKSQSALSRAYLEIALTPTLQAELSRVNTPPTPLQISQLSEQIDHALQTELDPHAEAPRTPRLTNAIFDRLGLISAVRQQARTETDPARRQRFYIPIDHALDLYIKQMHVPRDRTVYRQAVQLTPRADQGTALLSVGTETSLSTAFEAPGEHLVRIENSWYEHTPTPGSGIALTHLTGPQPEQPRLVEGFELLSLSLSSAERNLTNQQIAIAEALIDKELIVQRLNTALFFNADSTRPEIAGAAAAIIGSILTMLITSLFALPIGILAAIYLEELAPLNRFTNLLEININNLAAIPSIIFGLLGAAVFLNTFGMPRSVPFVGGLVLGLLVLPTVIISSRAALAAVPYELRAGALALGASRIQTVFHHILPVAAPGIATGAILAMARAIGETAPLLLIGMVAFIHEIPSRANDEATVLPVLIYKWFGSAERAWEPITAAVILILILVLVLLNLTAVVIRWQMDKTWVRR